MFIREVKNRSGSTSIQIISKDSGKYKVVKSIGCANTRQEIETLKSKAQHELEKIRKQPSLFTSSTDAKVVEAFSLLSNADIRTVGPELIFGRIYDSVGYGAVKESLFKNIVIARLAFPLSKLKTSEYLYRYQGKSINVNKIYRFLDKLSRELEEQVQQIAFKHTQKVLNGDLSIVFYDMTTLYFEASDEDDLRKTGFSKDGKHSNPQIFIGLLVGLGGYAIGYDIFEGNTYEGHTLIPFLEKMQNKFSLGKPIVIADAGLLSKTNIRALEDNGYQFILGARIKNEDKKIQSQIKEFDFSRNSFYWRNKEIMDEKGIMRKRRLIVHHSDKRAQKDSYNRERGLRRLEKRLKSGKLTKSNINNRGYNKYLNMEGEVNIEIDYEKYKADAVWDGLKGYITNTSLSNREILDNYNNLWHIEKAFRMSKTDLRIRPIYHRLRRRIEAHICISFTAYTIYKELERALKTEKSELSLNKASEITHTIYQLSYRLPDSGEEKTQLLKMDDEQAELYQIIIKNF